MYIPKCYVYVMHVTSGATEELGIHYRGVQWEWGAVA